MARASTSSSSSRGDGTKRVLRIGLVLGSKIIEERLVHKHEHVTIGQSSHNMFAVPIEQLPRTFTVLVWANDHYELRFPAKMEGRISSGDQVLTLEQLKAKARRVDDYFVVDLGNDARGKLWIGEFSMLFQVIPEPPPQPKPVLPAAVRGSLMDRMDPLLMACMGITNAVAIVIWVYAFFIVDRPAPRTLAQQARQKAGIDEYVVEDFTQPVTPTEVAKAEDTKPAPEAGGKTKNEKPKSDPAPAGGGRTAADVEAAKQAAVDDAQRYASELFASGGDGPSDVERGMADRRPSEDIGRSIDAVREGGGKIAVGGTGSGGTRDGDARTGTSSGPGTGTGAGGIASAGDAAGKDEKTPGSRVTVSSKKAFDESTLTADSVIAKIKSAYMAGLQRCHKDLLKTDPTAAGTVTIAFTVNEKGRVVSPKATGFNSELDACIETRMAGWSFTPPVDSDGDPTDAGFEVKLPFQPN